MKKLLFSALACVAFAGSGFAANEVIKFPKSLDYCIDESVFESRGLHVFF